MQSNKKDIRLLAPDVDRDAPYAYEWFSHPEGRATLLSMGNAEDEIEPSTLEGEKATLREFLDLEKDSKQITRMIVVDGKTIGAVWVELFENHGVKPPSIHIMIGNPEYRGKGIGASVMQSAVDYVKNVLHAPTIYTRHLVSNTIVSNMNKGLGFVEDGEPYTDENGLTWQPIRLELSLG